jgi:hypothetical protein
MYEETSWKDTALLSTEMPATVIRLDYRSNGQFNESKLRTLNALRQLQRSCNFTKAVYLIIYPEYPEENQNLRSVDCCRFTP